MYEELLPKLKFCMSSFIWEQIHFYSSVISCANRLLFMFISGLTALLASTKICQARKICAGPILQREEKRDRTEQAHEGQPTALYILPTELRATQFCPVARCAQWGWYQSHAQLCTVTSLSPFVVTYAGSRWSDCSVIHCGEDTGSI